jgi:nicotinate dehydrogenase subunit B
MTTRHLLTSKIMINIDQPGQPSWGSGEPTATAVPAAIANAIYDAIGARLCSIPITAEKVKAAMLAVA